MCNRTFKTMYCPNAHELDDCKKRILCKKCNRIILRSKIDANTGDHEHCSEIYCRPCGKHVMAAHKFCYVQEYVSKNSTTKMEENENNIKHNMTI